MSNHSSDFFRSVQNDSQEFGHVPQGSETFGNVRNGSEARENHTLSVREVARLFEQAGVARTERSVTNWCRPNKTGIARLDAYFDPNDRKFFITPESVAAAIREELARAKNKASDASEPLAQVDEPAGADTYEIKSLRQEIVDLKITNRGKDYFIEQLQKEREAFADERQRYLEDLMRFNRRVGELELQLKQIESPKTPQVG